MSISTTTTTVVTANSTNSDAFTTEEYGNSANTSQCSLCEGMQCNSQGECDQCLPGWISLDNYLCQNRDCRNCEGGTCQDLKCKDCKVGFAKGALGLCKDLDSLPTPSGYNLPSVQLVSSILALMALTAIGVYCLKPQRAKEEEVGAVDGDGDVDGEWFYGEDGMVYHHGDMVGENHARYSIDRDHDHDQDHTEIEPEIVETPSKLKIKTRSKSKSKTKIAISETSMVSGSSDSSGSSGSSDGSSGSSDQTDSSADNSSVELSP